MVPSAKRRSKSKAAAPHKLLGGAKSFRATLERMPGNLGWVIVRVPFKVEKVWGARGMFRVKGEINDFPFCKSLFPTKRGEHFLLVNNAMQNGAGVHPGMPAEFRIEPDTEKHVVPVPPELKKYLAQDATLRHWFEKLNNSTRNWIGNLAAGPKGPASRQRRAEQIAEWLLATMDAERELPPALQRAFAMNPRALEGWQLMSPTQRRGNLLAIFYYRGPGARERRIEKVMADAAAIAERKAERRASRPGTETLEE
jgi:uncharacterized protein YdeI (YjbR/CyaY-like superfamily)